VIARVGSSASGHRAVAVEPPVWLGGRVSRRRRHAIALWTALLCWACTVLWFSSLSPADLPDAAFAFWDKLNHAAAFSVGGWLAASALRVSRPQARPRTVLIVAVLLVAAFGILDEALQTLTPGRAGAEPGDWIADVIGATAGALLTLPALRRRSLGLDAQRGRP
jgi:VanZ family protein